MDGISRVAFTVFGMDIYWYAVIIVTGMILGCLVAAHLVKNRGMDPEIILDLMIWLLPISILGARAYYVVFEFDSSWSFADIFAIRDGGLAIYGGVIAGFIVAVIFAKKRKFTKYQMLNLLDCLVVGLILGQAIGRWGNFFNQEAHGGLITNTALQFFPMGVLINGNWYLATFFYEFTANIIGFALLFVLNKKFVKSRGFITCGYFIWYGTARMFIEGLRTDSLYFLKETIGEVIRVSQVLSGLMVIGGIAFAIFLYKNGFFTAGDKQIATDGDVATEAETALEAEEIEETAEEAQETEKTEVTAEVEKAEITN
ncbi:MAG: prolipoprotein diacylglyceryl transferase [Bacillota bacterium]